MKAISAIFFKGLAAVLPAVVTIGILVWLGMTSERWVGGIFRHYLGDWYLPGMGLIFTVLGIFLVGLLVQAYLVRQLFAVGEGLLSRIPLVKTIYSSVQDLMSFIARSRDNEGQKVVMVEISFGDFTGKFMGFITREDYTNLPEGIGGDDCVTVYLPMSYQIGGYAIVIPRSRITPLDLSVEAGMRYAITAGVTTSGMGTPPNPQPPQ
ncbi:MAG: DUF502 domain-containing protein [Planctomycetota bacterium]|nr:MAG: DUF502 domain-containing protein [Planctomycetota bacterium]